jgi:DNA-binding SARP family transcriptional activator/tetratricopeptide (TPR) repeat protein
MRFRMLGPVRVHTGVSWVPVAAERQRLVLAVLLVDAGRAVSMDRLADALWGNRPPPGASNTVRAYVMRLRRLLGDGALVTRGRGYELVAGPDDIDAAVFERLVASGRHELDESRAEAGSARLEEALALWHGPVLADVPASPWLTARVAHLEQVRLTAEEDHIAALLDLDRHEQVVDDLNRLVEQSPLRERRWVLLMLALQRCGRRAEALDAFHRARQVLRDELGLDPGLELRELQRTILTEDPPPEHVTIRKPPVTPAQLPNDVAWFTGRDSHLARLDAKLAGEGDPAPTAVVISALDGSAGVGKTALAVHWAHRVRDRFPDGQLYVNLRGYAAGSPLRPIEALAGFLHALGVPAEEIPADEGRAAALYRSLLAGRRMLVVLDNANHPDQVRPLLPGGAGCLVLITSRDQLAGLTAVDGATRITLDVLTPAEARTLVTRMLGAWRAEAEPESVDELARLCGHLPLALRIAAANVSTHPRWTVADYITRLRADPLAALQVDGDPQAAVRATFDLSYAALPADAQHLFRVLGLGPGPDLTADAAAALAGIAPAQAARLLDRLSSVHLVDERAPGRYTMHDLLRRYAAEQAATEDPEPDRHAALGRLFDHYLHTADAAAAQLPGFSARLPRPAAHLGRPIPGFGDRAQALAWLDAERANLVAAVRHAAAHGPRPAAWMLADTLYSYFDLGIHAVDWQAVAQAGLAAAQAEGDARARAAAHLNLGGLHGRQSRYRTAIDHYTHALTLSAQTRWTDGRASVLGRLGCMHWELGDLQQAAEFHTQALALNRRIGRLDGQASNHNNLGLAYWQMGRLEDAADQYAQALALYQQAGSRGAEGNAHGNLGDTYHALGRYDDARISIEQALAIHRKTGNRGSESAVVCCLAAIDRDAGRHAEAHGTASTAVHTAAGIGDRRIEADARNVLASVDLYLGQHHSAVEGHQRALRLACDIGNRYGQTEAHLGLAAAHRYAGRCEEASEHAQQALGIACPSRYRIVEGQVLTVAAAIHVHQGQPDQATTKAEQALAIHRHTGHRLGCARTHLILSHTLHGDSAQRHLDYALAQFGEIGADWTGHARVLLRQPAA